MHEIAVVFQGKYPTSFSQILFKIETNYWELLVNKLVYVSGRYPP